MPSGKTVHPAPIPVERTTAAAALTNALKLRRIMLSPCRVVRRFMPYPSVLQAAEQGQFSSRESLYKTNRGKVRTNRRNGRDY